MRSCSASSRTFFAARLGPDPDLLGLGLGLLAEAVGRAGGGGVQLLGLGARGLELVGDLLLALLQLDGAAGGRLVELRGPRDELLLDLVAVLLGLGAGLLQQPHRLLPGAGPHLGGLLLGEAEQLLGPEAEALLRRRRLAARRGAEPPVLLLGGFGVLGGQPALPLGLGELGPQRGRLVALPCDVLVDLAPLVTAQRGVERRARGPLVGQAA